MVFVANLLYGTPWCERKRRTALFVYFPAFSFREGIFIGGRSTWTYGTSISHIRASVILDGYSSNMSSKNSRVSERALTLQRKSMQRVARIGKVSISINIKNRNFFRRRKHFHTKLVHAFRESCTMFTVSDMKVDKTFCTSTV